MTGGAGHVARASTGFRGVAAEQPVLVDLGSSPRASVRLFPVIAGIAMVLVTLLAAGRDLERHPDTINYLRDYEAVAEGDGSGMREPLYFWLAKAASLFNDYRFYFGAIAASSGIALGSFWMMFIAEARRRSFPRLDQLDCLFLVITLSSPFFWNHQLNVIRSGLAIPLFLSFVLLRETGHSRWAAVMATLAVMAHFSMLVFVFSMLFSRLSNRVLTVTFGVLVLVYVSGLLQRAVPVLIATMPDTSFQGAAYYLGYLAGDDRGYRAGVRFDFLGIVLLCVLLAHWVQHGDAIRPSLPMNLRKSSLLLSYPFLSFGWMPYSDRLLGPIWYLYPVLIAAYAAQRVHLSKSQRIVAYFAGALAVLWQTSY